MATDARIQSAPPQLRHARVGLVLPLITPLECERQFWTSKFYEAAARDHDWLHLFVRLCTEYMILVRMESGIASDVVAPFRLYTTKALSLVVVNTLLKVFLAREHYTQLRWWMVLHLR